MGVNFGHWPNVWEALGLSVHDGLTQWNDLDTGHRWRN